MNSGQLIENPGLSELRKFGLISGGIVAVLFGVFLPWVFDYQWPQWPWIVSGVLGVWAFAHPGSLFLVYRPWMKFGQIAGWINTRIILGLMFYLVFFPVGLLMKIVGYDPMAKKLDRRADSYRIESASLDRDHTERPY